MSQRKKSESWKNICQWKVVMWKEKKSARKKSTGKWKEVGGKRKEIITKNVPSANIELNYTVQELILQHLWLEPQVVSI